MSVFKSIFEEVWSDRGVDVAVSDWSAWGRLFELTVRIIPGGEWPCAVCIWAIDEVGSVLGEACVEWCWASMGMGIIVAEPAIA